MQRTGQSLHPRLRLAAIVAVAASLLSVMTANSYAAGLLIADGGFGGVLEIKEHAATVTINNGVAVTEIEQTFVNTEDRIVEALYIFPVPKAASVANFSMWINGQEVVGEVVEKKRAREIYESYKQTRRDPGLLEQVDYKTFEMRIFPIPAGAEQRIALSYYQELDVDHNWASYTYPLATVGREGLDQRATGRFALTFRVKSEVPIVEMHSPSHADAFAVSRHTQNFYEASLETTGGELSRDLVIDYKLARPRTGLDLITSRPKGEDGYFLLTLTAGEELSALSQPMDYVFVLDISGSMANDQKLALSTRSINAFVDQLGAEDRFEVISFNRQPTMMFSDLRIADVAGKQQAEQFLRSVQARGGTVLGPAIHAAYRYGNPDRPLNVVILSDGMTEQRDRTKLLQLMAARPSHVRVFAVGVGNEIDRPLLQQMAQDAGGLAAFVSHGADFDRQAQAFRRKLTHPAADNVRISIAGVDVYDIVPGDQLPSLYHGSPVRVFGRYRGKGDGKITLKAQVMGQDVEKPVAMNFPAADAGNPEIERMWAWHRIHELLGQADRTGTRDAVLDQVVQLGEGYSIVTEYTSFIVLENDAEYRRWKIERRNNLRLARDRAKGAALNEQLTQLRQQAAEAMGPAPQRDDTLASAQQPVQATRPNNAQPQVNQPRPVQPQSAPQPQERSRGVDLNLNGGGALDPFTLGLALMLGGAAVAGACRKRNAIHH